MRLMLEAQLCNVVITDGETGYDLADLLRRDRLEDMNDAVI